MTLSSCEAEYVALCETCAELLYIRQILEFLGVEIDYPMIIYVDNVGAIYLANNESSTRTKHVDVRYHFVRELTEEPNPVVKIEFCRSEDNRADVYTKNVGIQLFKKHNDPHFKMD